MQFLVNEILKEESTGTDFRIIWIDPEGIILYLIDLTNEKAFPEKKHVSDLHESIVIGEWIKIRNEEYPSPLSFIDYEQKYLIIRDRAWDSIKDLVQAEPNIFEKSYRSKAIKSACELHGLSYPAIRKYLYKYWSRGKTINTLLPDYKNSGARGIERKVGEKKLGRPAIYKSEGINIDDKTKQIFKIAIEKYYLTSKQNSLKGAYNMMLKKFYVKDVYYEYGVEKLILEEENSIPSLVQFKYWYEKQFKSPEVLIARKGEKKFNKDHRAVLNHSLSEVYGPGSRYQIDATVGDVYLVSKVNRNWIIGRPVIYIVIDVFSRMVVGMYVGLEGPSWAGAIMALTNVVADKKAYCAEYGIEIKKEDWPCQYLPEILLADKGEFEGYNVERLITAFNLHVENTASYRADWKGIVEKQFDLIQTKVKPLVPGYIDTDFQQRGARDYRLDAVLTIDEFTKILIKQILQYNTKHYMKSYTRDSDLVAAGVLPIPLELWNWGVTNRTGKLKLFPEELVRLQLLPRGQATVNYKGIQFKGISYSCEKAIKESWFEIARNKGSWKVELAYDNRNMDHVYLINVADGSFESCYMLEPSKRYKGLSLDEINYWRKEEIRLAQQQEHGQKQKEVDYISETEAIVENAKKSKEMEKDNSLSKSQQVGEIREHRKNAKENQRKVETKPLIEHEKKEVEIVTFPNKVVEITNFERTGVLEFLKRRKENKDV